MHSGAQTARSTVVHDESMPDSVDLQTIEADACLFTIELERVQRNTETFVIESKENRLGAINFDHAIRRVQKNAR